MITILDKKIKAMKNFLTLFFILSNFILQAQTDTVKMIIYRGFEFNTDKTLQSPYVLNLPNSGIKNEYVRAYIDTTGFRPSVDSVRVEKKAKNYFAAAQRDYLNLRYKPFPDIEGLDMNDKTLSISKFIGKKTVLFFFDASRQESFSNIAVMSKLYKEFSPKGVQFLMLAAQDKNEMAHYVEKQNLPFPIMPNVKKAVQELVSKNFNFPYFLVLNEKGQVYDIACYPQFGSVVFEEDEPFNLTPGKTMTEKDFEAIKALQERSYWVQIVGAKQYVEDEDFLYKKVKIALNR